MFLQPLLNLPGQNFLFFRTGAVGFLNLILLGLRLCVSYEMTVAGTPAAHELTADRSAALGQRDIHIEVYPLRTYLQAPLTVDSVTTPAGAGSSFHFVSALFQINGPTDCPHTRDNGDWVNTSGSAATGICNITIKSGVFSMDPVCVATPRDPNCANLSLVNSSTITLVSEDCAGSAINDFVHVMCHGPR